uniref:Uncharacterized protein n=2 Tax=Vitis vinifera TaxID=29760 RepID=F6GTQ5_VITVI
MEGFRLIRDTIFSRLRGGLSSKQQLS